MRPFLLNLVLVSCSLFVFSVTAGAHPHKSGEMHHGPSLENYQIEINFSASHLTQDGSTPNIKLVAKNEANKEKSEIKQIKSKTIQKNEQIQKKHKEQRK
jgi:hypothetical protein